MKEGLCREGGDGDKVGKSDLKRKGKNLAGKRGLCGTSQQGGKKR
jgi:hypothetical protein